MVAVVAAGLVPAALAIILDLRQQSVLLTFVEEIIEHFHGNFVSLIILEDDEIQFIIHFVTLLSSVY
jgi:hypothetical protein